MARSKHTRPDEIRARDRVKNPRSKRGKDDQSTQRKVIRVLKEAGLDLSELTTDGEQAVFPRIKIQRPRNGFCHPATRADITNLLHKLGPRCYYGLKSIELRQRTELESSNRTIVFGRTQPKGIVTIYELSQAPWIVPGSLHDDDSRRFSDFGATIEVISDGLQTKISWTEEMLKQFVLLDVLLHEIGHHLIQQYKGKRPARVLRSKNHEQLAELYAQRCRAGLVSEGDIDEG